MNQPRRAPRLLVALQGLVLLLTVPPATAAQQPLPTDPPAALPYDLAFAMASFPWSSRWFVSPDGRMA